jgi:predicted nucleotidyltransferase component of viral defense system
MLTFEQVKEYFTPDLAQLNPKGMLVEYLQYECLDSIFKQKGAEKLSFIGGTAIRLIYNSQRFSEDLDFDNFGLDPAGLKRLFGRVCKEISVKGFEVEYRFIGKGKNFHCYLKFPAVLRQYGLPAHHQEKILVSIDAEHKTRFIKPEVRSINKFGIFCNIMVNPVSVLLAQKLLAILLRKREKGRDFYDVSFLGGLAKPD